MVPKALYILLIACIFGAIIQMSLATSSESTDKSDSSGSSGSSESSETSDSSDSSDSTDSSEPEKKSTESDDQKPQKPPTKQEEGENKTVIKKLEIVLPTVPALSHPGLKPNVEKAKEMVARRLNSGSNFVNAVANGIRAAVHAVKPVIAIGDLIAKIIRAFVDIAALNPIPLGILILQEGMKTGMSVMSASIPFLLAGAIAVAI